MTNNKTAITETLKTLGFITANALLLGIPSLIKIKQYQDGFEMLSKRIFELDDLYTEYCEENGISLDELNKKTES